MKSTMLNNYSEVQVSCSCGNTFVIRSVLNKPLVIETCSHCHPFYAGKQKVIPGGQRLERHNKRYGY